MGDVSAAQDGVASCVRSVEAILNYTFLNKKLLQDALTHPSLPKSTTSYHKLEFLGDAVLSSAVTNFLFITYPHLEPGPLSALRVFNCSDEKLARVAVRHGFYHYVSHFDPRFVSRIQEFVLAVMEEDEILLHGGVLRAPRILAGIVDSIAGAVYVDCGFDLKAFWLVFRGLLEPIVTLENLQEYERPMKALKELCQAQKKKLRFKHWRMECKYFASISVGGKLVASASAYQLESAMFSAAREALRTLEQPNASDGGTCGFTFEVDKSCEVVAAKLKLSSICVKQKWPEPSYRVEKEVGKSDVKKYVCSAHVEVDGTVLVMHGDEQSTVEDAENSAASCMICSLLAHGHLQRRRRKRKRKSSINSEGNDKEDQHQESSEKKKEDF